MRYHALIAASTIAWATSASAQQNTNCQPDGIGGVSCTTTGQPGGGGIDWSGFNQRQQQINQQNQQNMNQSFQNLGDAIAQSRENRRQRKALEAQQARDATVMAAVQAAMAGDNTTVPPPPVEAPVLLSCIIESTLLNLALYEKAGRVDVTAAGITKARAAIFTPDTVSWSSAVWRSAVSRIDMSMTSVAILPEMAGAQKSGRCSLAERKF